MIYKYDATMDKCPLPLVKMRLILKKMTQIDRCIIRIADKGSKTDIPKYLQEKGFQYTMAQLDSSVLELTITTGN
ncbi:transcriptional regulator [Thalassotalea insulae]|uniref:Transcriptional regulator n=1 Tax=Thalassotalea insulae TaxID=2056778 RepID=A0ABQ6GY34_9GAMM|nr:sulfurtransferase TusA family protein [Thalassotalea insulae]GLX80109.1 transcriptional regulator [Thalassotalea insulae]